MKFSRILVGTDFSPISNRAVEAGVRVAKRTGARLTIAHVMPRVAPLYSALPLSDSAEIRKYTEAARQNVQRRLEALVERARKAGARAEGAFLEAEPVAGLLTLARRTRADLIVLATHGRGMAAHLMLGSVTEKIVRVAPCSVLIVKKSKWREKGRVLISLDDSPMAVDVARQGAQFAAKLRAKISVVHAVHDTRWVAEAIASAQPVKILRAISKLGIERAKKEVAATLAKARVKVAPGNVIIREGRAQDVIVREAARGPVCTVVGTHGRGGASRILLGSVAESVIRHAKSPVLVIKFGKK